MQAEHDLKWSLEQNNDRIVLRLIGELSRNTLLPLWNAYNTRPKEGQRDSFLSAEQIADKDIYCDLAQISRIDSAGFALLCDLVAHCRRLQRQNSILLLEDAPPQLLTLADLFGLSDWLKPFLK